MNQKKIQGDLSTETVFTENVRESFMSQIKNTNIDFSVIDVVGKIKTPDAQSEFDKFDLDVLYADDEPQNIRDLEQKGYRIVPSDFFDKDAPIKTEIYCGSIKKGDGAGEKEHRQILMARDKRIKKQIQDKIELSIQQKIGNTPAPQNKNIQDYGNITLENKKGNYAQDRLDLYNKEIQ